MRTPQKAKWALLVHDLELQSSAFLKVRIGGRQNLLSEEEISRGEGALLLHF